jgi:hypothetical protein
VLFVAVLLLSLVVITPRRSWVFFHHPHRLLAVYLTTTSPWSLADFRRAIAHYNGSYVDTNARQLRFLFRAFAAASVCLVAELVLWLWILAR